MKTAIAPAARIASRCVVPMSWVSPATSPAPPSTPISTPTSGVSRARRPRGGAAPSRSALTGAMRVARRAGPIAASTVTPMPTTRQTTTVCHGILRPVAGRPKPTSSKTRFRPHAKPRPRTRPTSVAASAITKASPTTVPRICRRLAPMVRSIANSRVRWATVMENVLKMMKAPTRTATPAKPSSAKRISRPISALSSLACSAESSAAVCTISPGSSRALRTRSASSSSETPSADLA